MIFVIKFIEFEKIYTYNYIIYLQFLLQMMIKIYSFYSYLKHSSVHCNLVINF